MKPDKDDRKELNDIRNNKVTEVMLRDKKVGIGWIKPDVTWKLTDLISEQVDEEHTDMRMRGQIPHKFAALAILNSYIKIKLFYPILWRWFYYVKAYTYEELIPVITTAKKKVQVGEYWMLMALSVEMMTTWKTLTKKEQEEYRRELMTAGSQLSEKNTDGL